MAICSELYYLWGWGQIVQVIRFQHAGSYMQCYKKSQTVSGATGRGRQQILGGAGVGTQVGPEVELNSREEGLLLTNSKLRTCTGHAHRYREDQLELAVRYLLDGVGTFILHLGVLRQYLRGGDWLVDVNLPGLKLVSQWWGQFQKLTSSLRCCGVGEIVDSRRGLTETLFGFGGPTFRSAVVSFFKGKQWPDRLKTNLHSFISQQTWCSQGFIAQQSPQLKVLLSNRDHHTPICNSHIQYTSPHNFMHIHNQSQPVHSKRSQNNYYGAWKQDI